MQKLALAPKLEDTQPETDRAPMEEMLQDLINEVRADAREAPGLFLAETIVPHGGE